MFSMEIKPEIEIDDLNKLDIRIGTVTAAERVEKSDKLVKLTVRFGEDAIRTILTGIGKFYTPEEFVGLQTLFIVNLKPRKMMGLESQGMIMAVDSDDDSKPVFLLPKDSVLDGLSVI